MWDGFEFWHSGVEVLACKSKLKAGEYWLSDLACMHGSVSILELWYVALSPIFSYSSIVLGIVSGFLQGILIGLLSLSPRTLSYPYLISNFPRAIFPMLF